MKIFAIGGGGNGRDGGPYEIKQFDKQIVKLAKVPKPHFLFVSFSQTTQENANSYYSLMQGHFTKLGCVCDHLSDQDLKDSLAIKDKIEKANIIYVGGGNTLRLMQKLRKYNIDKLIKKAAQKNVVLCGVSAGAICWCNCGNSDSRKFTSNSTQLIKVKGLGLLNVLMCPHYDVEQHRQPDLKRMMRTTKCVAIALDNCSALQIVDNNYSVQKTKTTAKAHKCFWKNGQYIVSELQGEGTIQQLTTK